MYKSQMYFTILDGYITSQELIFGTEDKYNDIFTD